MVAIGQRACSKLYCVNSGCPRKCFCGQGEVELQHLYGRWIFWRRTRRTSTRGFLPHGGLDERRRDVIFYDTTSLHLKSTKRTARWARNKLAGGQKYEALRKRGHSKNGRSDVSQLVVGLAVSGRSAGAVMGFPGNTVDVTTVENVKQDLRGWRLGVVYSWATPA